MELTKKNVSKHRMYKRVRFFTTLGINLATLALAIVSLREIDRVHHRLKKIERRRLETRK